MHAVKMRKHFLMLCAMMLCVSTVVAADYPQWRGPNRDGHSPETGLLAQWPENGPDLVWQIMDVGGGYGTPSVANGVLYIVVNEGMENELVKALDATTGKLLWSTRIGKVGKPDQQPNFPGGRSTPTVDGKQLYVLGSDGDLACLETKSGNIIWQKNLVSEFEGKSGKWAYSESPLVDGDVLVCAPGGTGATVVALNKNSGDVIWTSAFPGDPEAGYASITITTAAGVKQYIAYVGSGLGGIDAKTGSLLWHYEKTKGTGNMPTPVSRDALIYSSTTRVEGALIKLVAQGDSIAVEEVYQKPDLPNAIGGTVLVGNYLYGSNGKSLVCLDFKSGEIKWEGEGLGAGSICTAAGNLYFHGENGQVVLVAATPENYQEKGRFTPVDPPEHKRMEQAWAYPVVADGKLYVRDLGCLWCYSIK